MIDKTCTKCRAALHPRNEGFLRGLFDAQLPFTEHQDEGGGDHELVGEGVEEHAEGGDLAAAAGEEAVQAVGDRGGDKDGGGDQLLFAVSALPGEAGGEGPDQQWNACDAGERYGVGQIHGMARGSMGKSRIQPFSHKGRK